MSAISFVVGLALSLALPRSVSIPLALVVYALLVVVLTRHLERVGQALLMFTAGLVFGVAFSIPALA